MAPKTDHQRIKDLESAVATLVNGTTILYGALAELGTFLVKDGTLHTAHYRALAKTLEEVNARFREVVDYLSEDRQDGD